MTQYEIFKRSAKNFEQFAIARKVYLQTVDSIEEAQMICSHFNNTRTPTQISMGTKCEFMKI